MWMDKGASPFPHTPSDTCGKAFCTGWSSKTRLCSRWYFFCLAASRKKPTEWWLVLAWSKKHRGAQYSVRTLWDGGYELNPPFPPSRPSRTVSQ